MIKTKIIPKILLLDDHQQLVPLSTDDELTNVSSISKPIDAIFIPFRNESKHISALLNDLKCFNGYIYLMPSGLNNDYEEFSDYSDNVKVLDVRQDDFHLFFNSLLTSSNRHLTISTIYWDLPLKRNYALWFSQRKQFNRILIIDDDVRGLDYSLLQQGSNYLEQYALVGCFVEDFPDTSVVGHIKIHNGEKVKCFLSGSFLFINTSNVNGFFPFIYNEDWLFMLNHIIDSQIISIGNVTQLPYDPFHNPKMAVFQEFGEIIAEGLYALLHLNLLSFRFSSNIWLDILHERKQELLNLNKVSIDLAHQKLIDYSLATIQHINAHDCITFVQNWEDDIITWNNFLKETV